MGGGWLWGGVTVWVEGGCVCVGGGVTVWGAVGGGGQEGHV